jgi:hypothetical protein
VDLGQFEPHTQTLGAGSLLLNSAVWELSSPWTSWRNVSLSEIDRSTYKTIKNNFGDRPAGDICRIQTMRFQTMTCWSGGFSLSASPEGARLGIHDRMEKGVLFLEIADIKG